ncbi:ABC transporter ATP-binding protein [Streptomyces sp. WAC 01325]|uniref:ATP-binding cassette domain-containing protein n=1 Tax=Streptomyces sp. WAC 01325 TaxID=2203202 RepID=UPI000F8709A1|nr:ATP-binding cassette domain-containing protein [Streptomyces sp. WAC 01325]RSM90163.1 ABC transporter ATP-binding protein [Streptomyces sp. WAC 01325]
MGGTVAGVGVTALGLGLEGPRGWAFRGVSFEAEPGSLITIEGPSGTGRTCLLLALTGRMKSTEGTATVGGSALPKRMAAVRQVSAVAHVPGVTDLEPALTVAEHLHERALLQRRFGDSLRGLLRPWAERKSEERLRIDAALKAAGLDLASLPKGSRTAVRDLERPEALRLSLALALIGRPQLLGVDDTDLKLSDAERAEIWALLRSVAENGTTVVAVCSEAPAGTVVVSTGPTEPAEPGEPTAPTAPTAPTEPTDATDEAPASRDAQEGAQEDVQESDGKEAADALAEAGRA